MQQLSDVVARCKIGDFLLLKSQARLPVAYCEHRNVSTVTGVAVAVGCPRAQCRRAKCLRRALSLRGTRLWWRLWKRLRFRRCTRACAGDVVLLGDRPWCTCLGECGLRALRRRRFDSLCEPLSRTRLLSTPFGLPRGRHPPTWLRRTDDLALLGDRLRRTCFGESGRRVLRRPRLGSLEFPPPRIRLPSVLLERFGSRVISPDLAPPP